MIRRRSSAHACWHSADHGPRGLRQREPSETGSQAIPFWDAPVGMAAMQAVAPCGVFVRESVRIMLRVIGMGAKAG